MIRSAAVLLLTYCLTVSCSENKEPQRNPAPAPPAELTAQSRIPNSKRRLSGKEILDSSNTELRKLSHKFDDIAALHFYSPKSFTHYDNSNKLSLTIKFSDYYSTLRLKASYCGDDWIFFKRIYLSFDGITKELNFSEFEDKKSDNGGGEVWEWIVINVDDELLEYLENYVRSSNAKIRFSGKYQEDRKVTAIERKEMSHAIEAFKAIKHYQAIKVQK